MSPYPDVGSPTALAVVNDSCPERAVWAHAAISQRQCSTTPRGGLNRGQLVELNQSVHVLHHSLYPFLTGIVKVEVVLGG